MHRSNQRIPVELPSDNNENGFRCSARMQERENQGARRKNYYGPRIYRARKNFPHAENQETSFVHFPNNAWEQKCPPRMYPQGLQGDLAWQSPQKFRQNSYAESYIPDSRSDDVPKSSQNKRRNRRKKKGPSFVPERSFDSISSQSTCSSEEKCRLEKTVQDLAKEKEELLRENRNLQMMLNKQAGGNLPHDQASTFQSKVTSEVQHKFGKLMENELTCTICTEFFVKATTLSCSHTFCFDCITQWKTKKNICPICRTKINGLSSCIVIDNLIDKMVENLSTETQETRKAMVAERSKSKNKKHEGTRRNSHGETAASMYYTVPVAHQIFNELLEFERFSTGDAEYEFTDLLESWEDTSGDDSAYEIFNPCEICGTYGHWLNDCPCVM